MNHLRELNFKKRCGFTLAEIMIVIIIVGISASFALPRFTTTFERVRASEGVQLLTVLLGAQKAYEFENPGDYATDPDDLDVQITRAEYFNLPPTVANPADPVNNPIARIRRRRRRDAALAYWLEINENGDISCANAGGPFTCGQSGY